MTAIKTIEAWEREHCNCDGTPDGAGPCFLHEIPGDPDRSLPPEDQTRIGRLLAVLYNERAAARSNIEARPDDYPVCALLPPELAATCESSERLRRFDELIGLLLPEIEHAAGKGDAPLVNKIRKAIGQATFYLEAARAELQADLDCSRRVNAELRDRNQELCEAVATTKVQYELAKEAAATLREEIAAMKCELRANQTDNAPAGAGGAR
jgi:hypothetical protein